MSDTPTPADQDRRNTLHRQALAAAQSLIGQEHGFDREWAESFDDETGEHARRYQYSAIAAAGLIVRSEPGCLSHLSEALNHIGQCRTAASNGENTVTGFDPEHTEELESQFRQAQQLADQAEAAVKEFVAYLEGYTAAGQKE